MSKPTVSERQFTPQQSAIALHRCLVDASLETPYKAWASHAHKLDISDQDRVDYLLAWDLNPDDYDDPSGFANDYQLVSLLKKAQFTDQVDARAKEKAYTKFMDAEHRCHLVNEHIRSGFKCSPWFGTVLGRAKKTIAYVLGDIKGVLEHMEQHADSRQYTGSSYRIDRFSVVSGSFAVTHESPKARFGPGVSVAPPRPGQTKPSTYDGWERTLRPSTTRDHIFRSKWESVGWADQVEVPGDVMTFVPKRYDEARTICPAPALNMRSQLLVGSFMKDRMNLVLRNNLRCQERNRSLARLGSLCNSYATIDLSAASDSIAYMLVLELLPFDWFHLLDGIRSVQYFDIIRNEWATYAKFSAMGNGFTFELESLIFYAIAEAAAYLSRGGVALGKEEISVFGDDIIVPKDTALDVMSALQLSGFVINTEKSFIEGPFRESCGGDFFNGWCVTPTKLGVFNDETQLQSWCVFYSNFYYASVSTPRNRVGLPWLSRALRFVKCRIREHLPNISTFREEWKNGEPEPSYRWLPGDPSQFEHVYFDKNYQSLQPKRFVGYRKTIKAVYCLPDGVAGAAWLLSGPTSEVELSSSVFGLHRRCKVDMTRDVHEGDKWKARSVRH